MLISAATQPVVTTIGRTLPAATRGALGGRLVSFGGEGCSNCLKATKNFFFGLGSGIANAFTRGFNWIVAQIAANPRVVAIFGIASLLIGAAYALYRLCRHEPTTERKETTETMEKTQTPDKTEEIRTKTKTEETQ